MNPRIRIAQLAEQLGPRRAHERESLSTAEEAAVLLRFAPPHSKQARRLKRQAKGIAAPSPLTNDEARRLEEILDAARTSAATPQAAPAVLPPPSANMTPTDALDAATDAPAPRPHRYGTYGGSNDS